MPRTNLEAKRSPRFAAAIVKGLCPRCGAQSIFDVGAQFHARCRKCGLNFEKLEAGGRFAALITFLLIILLICAALLLQKLLDLSLWMEIAIWVPITIFAVLYAVRSAKAGWLILRYLKRQEKEQQEREQGQDHG